MPTDTLVAHRLHRRNHLGRVAARPRRIRSSLIRGSADRFRGVLASTCRSRTRPASARYLRELGSFRGAGWRRRGRYNLERRSLRRLSAGSRNRSSGVPPGSGRGSPTRTGFRVYEPSQRHIRVSEVMRCWLPSPPRRLHAQARGWIRHGTEAARPPRPLGPLRLEAAGCSISHENCASHGSYNNMPKELMFPDLAYPRLVPSTASGHL